MWVGRNEKSNRKLTFQKARGRDFWMHLRDLPGAHLIIPMRGDSTPDRDLLLAAAQIALLEGKLEPGTGAETCCGQLTPVSGFRSGP